MNYKFLSTIVASFLLQATVFANEPLEKGPTQYRALKQFTKWFVSANAGTQFFIGDHDKQISLGKRLTPHYELSVGKWVNQSFGIRGGINGYEIKGLTKAGPLATSNQLVVGEPHLLYDQKFNFVNIHADLLFHWSNDAYDLDLNRLYNIIPYGGLGIIKATNMQKQTNLTLNLGVIQTLKLNNTLDLNLDIKGNIISDSFDGEKGGKSFEGNGVATVGITYNFR